MVESGAMPPTMPTVFMMSLRYRPLLFVDDPLAKFTGNKFAGPLVAELVPMAQPLVIAKAMKKSSIASCILCERRRQIQNLKSFVLAEIFYTLIGIEKVANAYAVHIPLAEIGVGVDLNSHGPRDYQKLCPLGAHFITHLF